MPPRMALVARCRRLSSLSVVVSRPIRMPSVIIKDT